MSRWTMVRPENDYVVSGLVDELGVPSSIARLLANRRISTFEKSKLFFRGDLSVLHDPFLMKDMDKAAQRLAHAIRNQEKVVVYGDYDVDGTTATAILYIFLKDFGAPTLYYIPHRFKDGYGISEDGIDFALQQGAKLIVSVDCGITAVDEACIAKEKGLDLIICDHHNQGECIPECAAVLDPKRHDCTYPFDGLSGAGVGFKLVQGTLLELGLPLDKSYEFLDLLAISIASDIVPIIDENRILMREGLAMLNSNPRVGLDQLLKLIHVQAGKITTSKIVFSIGPRINAAGRMGDASTAVELLIAQDEAAAKANALELEAINVRRRKTDTETMEKAMALLDNELELKSASVVLHDPTWHLGVIGIVASRLVDRYCRPAIMLSTVDGQVKGSARSVRGFNIYDALKQCDDLLVQFGGHEFAAGLTLMEENLSKFKIRFESIVQKCFDPEDFEPEIRIDTELNLSEVDPRYWKLLEQFEPHGPNNLSPVFVSHGMRVVGTPTIVGNGHLKFKVAQNGSIPFEAIGFNLHEFHPLMRSCEQGCLSLVYALEKNTWNGKTHLQLRVKDVRVGSPDEIRNQMNSSPCD